MCLLDPALSQKSRRFVTASDLSATGSIPLQQQQQQQQDLLTSTGLDLDQISRILRGPDVSGASMAEDRVPILERHLTEQKELIEMLLRLVIPRGLGEQRQSGHMDGGPVPVVGLGLVSQEGPNQQESKDDRPV